MLMLKNVIFNTWLVHCHLSSLYFGQEFAVQVFGSLFSEHSLSPRRNPKSYQREQGE